MNRNKIRYFIIFISTFAIALLYKDQVMLTKHALQRSVVEFLTPNLKQKIKEYLLPYNEIEDLKKEIIALKRNENILDKLSSYALDNDLRIKKQSLDLKFKSIEKKLKFKGENLTLYKFKPRGDLLLRGINNTTPASAYLDKYQNNIFLVSSTGVLGYSKKNESELIFKQIKNNINSYISKLQMEKGNWFSVKDLLIHQNKIFVSFTDEIKPDCWNTSLIYGDLNYKEITFKPFFRPSQCIHRINNKDNIFNAHQSGGRIVGLNKYKILLSMGDFRNRYLAQENKSVNGKILSININNKKYEILSMGHRNVQGLLYDNENKIIVSTEHGPRGGDEINILNLLNLNPNEIANFGWPVSSYGEHYVQSDRNELGWTSKDTDQAYKNYPLYKSHKKYGFIEPVKYYVPSIGISEVVSIDPLNKIYIHSSLRDKALNLFTLDRQNRIKKNVRIEINERIRDMIKYENQIILFLEDTASIGIINIDDIDYR